ncbi:Calcium-dependent lipid-binding (CaLB domain) family protein [Striga hermonthica]|uniref:Calcium-dependent lipid-binding (CaLB domain) family protein n=1 Tax=Striga hermonthica TaxID=68872 RepID=A0A9N7N8L9_STRHE|nr:Calcium-dependent lipid-binding (CaLB domain) family protein [Striga hermonthica]
MRGRGRCVAVTGMLEVVDGVAGEATTTCSTGMMAATTIFLTGLVAAIGCAGRWRQGRWRQGRWRRWSRTVGGGPHDVEEAAARRQRRCPNCGASKRLGEARRGAVVFEVRRARALSRRAFVLEVRKHFFIAICPCAAPNYRNKSKGIAAKNVRWAPKTQACSNGGSGNPFNYATKRIVLKRCSEEEEDYDSTCLTDNGETERGSYYSSTNFGEEDPIVDKLRNQLGVIHPIPSPPPINRNVFGLFAFFFFVGVVFDKLWTSRKRNGGRSMGEQVPSSLSSLLEKDLQRKESVEWVNMVLGKLWKVYRGGIENWIIGLLQPVIDNLKKPDYVERVVIKQFSLGDEPLAVRSVDRRTSRRVNDLQYQIGLRYTGGARMLLLLSLKFGIFPIAVPVGVRDFDIDGELWVKLRLIPTEPWVGAASWAFVSLPKIKFELSPFRLFNLMGMLLLLLFLFLTKLLTEDLPKLFVRPKKIVLDFQKGKAVGPVPYDTKSAENQEGNNEFAGELSVTLLDARKLSYIFYGKTDPYVILKLGNQVIRSKRNSQTTVIGPPGEPIWNQDFHLLVADPRKEKLFIEVKDSLGFTDLTVGTALVDLGSLKDTVPADRIVVLRGGWSLFGNGSAGEILLRLTYKAYVEDEEDERSVKVSTDMEESEDELSDSDEQSPKEYIIGPDKESFMDVLAALLVSEEFRGIMTSETLNANRSLDADISSPTSESYAKTELPAPANNSGSTLFWLAFVTSIAVLIALNMGGANLFNP